MMTFARGDGVKFEPGTQWAYSQIGFLVLGKNVIEIVTGASYYDYLREHIFTPAGMANTDNYQLNLVTPDLAVGYGRKTTDNGVVYRKNLFRYLLRGSSAAGAYSTREIMKIYRYTLAVVGLALTLMGSETNAFEDDPFSISHGPYLQQLTEASVMIVWFTSRESVSRVEYGTGDNYRTFPQWGSLLHSATAKEHGLVDAYTTAHKVLITGLQPGKTYKYRVVSTEFLQFKPYEVIYGDSIVSPIYQFETLDPNKPSFSFIQLSDIHEHAARLDTMLQAVDWENIDLVFYTGDAIDYFEEESQIFDGFLDMSVQHYATEKPLVYIRGNHETRGRYARRLMDFFPTGSQRYYYSFNQGAVHFIVMDSGEDKEDEHPVYADLVDFDPYREAQAKWLKQDVQSEGFKRATFRVALFHIPPYGERHRHGEDHLTDLWGPVFNEAGIDLMLCGHRHRFSRHDPETGKNTYPLVITGINNVTRVDVTPEKLQVIVSHKNGDVVDTFTVPAKRTGTSAR